jgi:hypothetical protein
MFLVEYNQKSSLSMLPFSIFYTTLIPILWYYRSI